MHCFDTENNYLGTISCFPRLGEEHGWYDENGNQVFQGICIGFESKKGYCPLKVAIFQRT